MKAIINANIVLENGIFWDGYIIIAGAVIKEVGHMRDFVAPTGFDVVDADGLYVGPGFVDLHVHNAGEKTTYFDAEEACEYFLERGTTTLMATPPYELAFNEFLGAIHAARASIGKARTLKGLYMEGPYINPKYGAFAHLNPWRGPINEQEFKALVDAAGTDAKVWTIAPEREGLVPFLEYARKVNPEVVFAVGHSEATPEQIRKLGRFKPTLQTHSMCATGRIPVSGGTRGYGPDEYCFKESEVFTELICDSCAIHVHSDMQQLLLHNKGVKRVVLVTDSAHSPYPAPKGYEHITDLHFDDKGGLAGSRLTMDTACRNIMTHTNCGIAQAFVMASLNPARVIGLDSEIGSVDVDKKADLIFVDDKFNVAKVMLAGKLVKE